MSPRVVGIDLSLQSTGLADSHGNTLRSVTKPTNGLPAELARLRLIVGVVSQFVDLHHSDDTYSLADLVVIEGPSFASTGGMQHTRGGLWWMTVDAVSRMGDGMLPQSLPTLVVTPSQRMMYATGKGQASKDLVLAAAIKRYGDLFDITSNDTADAVILVAIGMRMLGHPIDDLPKTHLRALTKLALPPER